jgi:hypothetical protein
MNIESMNKNMFYEKNRHLEDVDIGYDSPIYKATIYDKSFLLSVGQERKLVTKKNKYYFPVYLMNKKFVQCQIGALEYESSKPTKEERMEPYLDSSGDLDLNKFDEIVFYSFADYDFFQNINVFVSPAIVSEMENDYAKIAIEDEEDVNIEEEVFELTETDLKHSETIKKSEKALEHGVFVLDRSMKVPPALPEETKETAQMAKQDYRERKNMDWIEKNMKNNNYSIVETDDNGDCLFDTVRMAYEQIGYKTSIQKLRAIVAKEATEEMFTEYRDIYQGALGEKLELEKEIRRLVTLNKELKKRVAALSTSEKEQRAKLVKDANTIVQQHKDMKEKLTDSINYLGEFAFMANVNDLEDLRKHIMRPDFWGDNWVISVLEKQLQMKFIVLSESSYDEDDKNNVLQCTLNDSSQDITPEFYIITTYSGIHYRLITYKNKRIFKFDEIPYDIKVMVVIKCMERNAGTFARIRDFQNFKSKLGVSIEEEEDDEVEIPTSIQADETMVFTFYNKSNGVPKPGKGTNEKISSQKTKDYSNLALKKHGNWRRKLDDDWTQEFSIDGKRWQTVEHYYQASKFKKKNPHFFNLFALDSNDDISKDVEIAKAVGSLKGIYKKGKTVVQTRPSEIKIDPDFYGTRKDEEREKALYAKFSQNEDLKEMLKETKEAVLQKHIPKSKAEKDILLMKVRNRIQIE